MKILTEISARHIHISKEHLEKLFGKNYKLIPTKSLSQPEQFSTKEKIELINEKEKLNARITGPTRDETQVEISITDAIKLKLKPFPKLRVSGDLNETTGGITLKGPKGKVKLNKGVIIAKRHLHITNQQAKELGLKNNQSIKIKIPGERGLIFDNIIVRAEQQATLALHLDTDEANAAGIKEKTFGELIV